jgi:DNA-binding PadR family transcriptional regulator
MLLTKDNTMHHHAHTHHGLGRILSMIGRGHGPGRHRGGFMGGRGGFRGEVPGGRKLGADQLQLILLALLAERPSHGYELIKALDERSNGFYRPSPGMIYPALTYLEELGHVTVEADGTKKLHHLSQAGQAYLTQHREDADAILSQLAAVGQRMEQVRRAFAGEADEDGFGPDEFRQARRALRRALHDKRDADPAELRRVAEILRRAASEITNAA